MTISPPSASDPAPDPRAAFDLLHEGVRQWIWDRRWDALKDIQARSIPILLNATRDLVIAAGTATGKTEAAFLPIVSHIAGASAGSLHALYVSPLKALINDQFRRLDDLCERLDVPVHRWHGDVAANRKRALLDAPRGILLITPESLEALFVLRGYRLAGLFRELRYVVVDELHAFIGNERGRQLQSQLHRLDVLLRRAVPRVGLSATLGDMDLARDALRPGAGASVELVKSQGGGQELRAQLRGYVDTGPKVRSAAPQKGADSDAARDDDADQGAGGGLLAVADHLFATLCTGDNLVFANARTTVEALADRLRRIAERERIPNRFLAHHGSLSKELREDVEDRLKQQDGGITAVCTSTLELGIDIGDVQSVAQVGAPHSVAALRQRLGRSGRRPGTPSILRMYVIEPEIDERSDPVDALHGPLVQATAMLRLLIAGWCEPPESGALHLSTLVQQLMSLIAQYGGISPEHAFEVLCDSGPFRGLDARDFARFLRALAKHELVRQDPDGTLLLDEKGERIANHHTFFAAFQSPEQYRVLQQARLIGTIGVDHSLVLGAYLILGGRRWRVLGVDADARTVQVAPAGGGRVPEFESAGHGRVHDRVRQEMRAVWEGADEPVFLNRPARRLLSEARSTFVRLGFDGDAFARVGRDTLLFVCRGDRIMQTLELQLLGREIGVTRRGPLLVLERTEPDCAREHLEALAGQGPVDPVALARTVTNLRIEKFDWAVEEGLLARDYAARSFDAHGAFEALRGLLG